MAAKLAGWHQAQPPKASPHANHPFGTLSAFFSTGWAVSHCGAYCRMNSLTLSGRVGPGREPGVVRAFVQDFGHVLLAARRAVAVQQSVGLTFTMSKQQRVPLRRSCLPANAACPSRIGWASRPEDKHAPRCLRRCASPSTEGSAPAPTVAAMQHSAHS
jgi:hypothetical protein